MVRFHAKNWLHGGAVVALIVAPSVVGAQVVRRVAFDLPAQSLGESLKALALQSGVTVLAASEDVAARQAPALHGSYTPEEALRILLGASGLVFTPVEGGFAVRQARGNRDTGTASDPQDIVVTGSRLRGTAIASPIVRIGQEEIRDSGQLGLGDVVRRIPQSFGGGQNPGIGMNVPSASGVDVGGGSSLNLRGLSTLRALNLCRLRDMPNLLSPSNPGGSNPPASASRLAAGFAAGFESRIDAICNEPLRSAFDASPTGKRSVFQGDYTKQPLFLKCL